MDQGEPLYTINLLLFCVSVLLDANIFDDCSQNNELLQAVKYLVPIPLSILSDKNNKVIQYIVF